MLKLTESVFNSDKVLRRMDRKIKEVLVDQLAKDDLDSEERAHIAKRVKKMLVRSEKDEECNSEYWYECGVAEGKIKGIRIGVIAVMAGYVIGMKIRNK